MRKEVHPLPPLRLKLTLKPEIIQRLQTATSSRQIKALEQRLYEKIKKSGSFSWMGIFRTVDGHGRDRLKLLLSEKHDIHSPVSITESFNALAIATRRDENEVAPIELYFVNDPAENDWLAERIEKLQTDPETEYQHTKTELVYQEHFGQSQIVMSD